MRSSFVEELVKIATYSVLSTVTDPDRVLYVLSEVSGQPIEKLAALPGIAAYRAAMASGGVDPAELSRLRNIATVESLQGVPYEEAGSKMLGKARKLNTEFMAAPGRAERLAAGRQARVEGSELVRQRLDEWVAAGKPAGQGNIVARTSAGTVGGGTVGATPSARSLTSVTSPSVPASVRSRGGVSGFADTFPGSAPGRVAPSSSRVTGHEGTLAAPPPVRAQKASPQPRPTPRPSSPAAPPGATPRGPAVPSPVSRLSRASQVGRVGTAGRVRGLTRSIGRGLRTLGRVARFV